MGHAHVALRPRIASVQDTLETHMKFRLPTAALLLSTLVIGSAAATSLSLMGRLQNSHRNTAATFAPGQTTEMQEAAPAEMEMEITIAA